MPANDHDPAVARALEVRAHERLARIATYAPPRIVGRVVLVAACGAVSCGPSGGPCGPDSCQPNGGPCGPDGCMPNN